MKNLIVQHREWFCVGLKCIDLKISLPILILHILSDARKSSILAGSKEKCFRKNSEKFKENIVGPNTSLRVSRFSGTRQKFLISCWVMVLIIHCSPDLTRGCCLKGLHLNLMPRN